MQPIQLAIIDDEPKTRSFLRGLIAEVLPKVTVIGEADSVATGVQFIQKNQPNAILLDVEMSDGSGFDLLSQLQTTRPHVIFVTAYDHYAVQALRADAVDYIEKPVNPEELMTALRKIERLVNERVKPDYNRLLQSIQAETQQKIAVPSRSGRIYLAATEILCIKADGAYAEIFTEQEARPLVISKTLKEIQPSLEKLGFIRPHRSYLVNASKIKEISKKDGGYLMLSNGLQVPFSKQYKDLAVDQIREMTTFL